MEIDEFNHSSLRSSRPLDLVCSHCDQRFADLDELKTHHARIVRAATIASGTKLMDDIPDDEPDCPSWRS